MNERTRYMFEMEITRRKSGLKHYEEQLEEQRERVQESEELIAKFKAELRDIEEDLERSQ